ncbi:hypothetical protein M9H77_01784 [Catharanthus roseus]|uniref:Uncharacterized protein n=1 Tax=Catharanthus roseus TaxID=4058 RepID=A0ACC0C6J2_CATRO|nr:hypothetical protein M9H77_01784 [Catharanthus roseus]
MENLWILDLGCSNHMTGRKFFLQNIHPICPHIIGLPNGAKTFAVQEGMVSLSPTLKLHQVTSEPSHEHTLEPELELETNEKSGNPTSVPKPDEQILGNYDDDEEDHPKAQAQALRDYQLSRDRVWLFIHCFLCFCCCIFC